MRRSPARRRFRRGGQRQIAGTLLDHAGDEAVAPAVQGLDQALFAPGVAEYLAQRRDLSRQHRLANEGPGPERIQELLLRHHMIPIAHEVEQHVEGPRLEPDLLATPSQRAPGLVKLALSKAVDVRHLASVSHGGRRPHRPQRELPARSPYRSLGATCEGSWFYK